MFNISSCNEVPTKRNSPTLNKKGSKNVKAFDFFFQIQLKKYAENNNTLKFTLSPDYKVLAAEVIYPVRNPLHRPITPNIAQNQPQCSRIFMHQQSILNLYNHSSSSEKLVSIIIHLMQFTHILIGTPKKIKPTKHAQIRSQQLK